MSVETELRRLVIRELPLAFWDRMAKGAPRVYKESHTRATKDAGWGESEGRYMLPHFRHSLFEHLFRTSALAAGLMAVSKWNFAGNYEYTVVRAKRLVLMVCHVDGANEVVRPSLFRKESALVNHILSNPTLKSNDPKVVVFDPPKLYAAKEICAYIIHGASKVDPSSYGFVRVVFPEKGSQKYVENYDLFELYTISLSNAQSQDSDLDIAHPRLRRKKKGESENE